LKAERGRVTPEQAACLAELRGCGLEALVEAGDRMAEALLMTEYDVESGTTRRGEMEDSRIAWEALARPGDRREDDR